MNRALIMDRDGTLMRDSHYLRDPGGIRIYPGTLPALKKLQKRGWKLIVGTNQSGVSRGYLTLATLKRIHDRFRDICRRGGLRIDDIFFCPHHPDAGCACRKPATGMLEKAARKYRLDLERSFVVGDKGCDMEWGRRAGVRTILVLTGKGRRTLRSSKSRADHVARSLKHAADWILSHE